MALSLLAMNDTQPPRKRRSYRGVDSELRRRTRRNALIEAGLDLFGTAGYRATPVKAVCDHAGLTERYFYESFANREALLAGVFTALAADLDNRLRAAASGSGCSRDDRLRRMLEVFFHFVRDDPRRPRVMLFEVLGIGPSVDVRYQSAVRELAAILEAEELGLFPDESLMSACARRTVAIGLVGGITQIAVQWVLDEFRTPIDDIIGASLELFLAVAVRADTARGHRL